MRKRRKPSRPCLTTATNRSNKSSRHVISGNGTVASVVVDASGVAEEEEEEEEEELAVGSVLGPWVTDELESVDGNGATPDRTCGCERGRSRHPIASIRVRELER
jgi:hypothetical protein